MTINLVTGQPGHGKSYMSVRKIRDALESGRFVVTNVWLTDDWAEQMARWNWFRRLIPGRVDAAAASYRRRMFYVEDMQQLRRMRLPPCGKCRGCENGPGCQKEARGIAVLDEVHKWLNARTWDTDESGAGRTKAEATKTRLDVVWFFSTHRHLGWNIELITQDEANLDRQVRSLYETHTHLKNLRRFKLLGLFPIVPFNLFVAVTTWHDSAKTQLGVDAFFLNKRLARCYDTFGAARAIEDSPDCIYLGRLPEDGQRPEGRTADPSEAGDGRPDGRPLPAPGQPPDGDDPADPADVGGAIASLLGPSGPVAVVSALLDSRLFAPLDGAASSPQGSTRDGA